MNDYKTTIVILCYNKFNLTNDLLISLQRFEKDNIDEIIVVDNGSTEQETKDGLQWWKDESGLPVRVRRIENGIGFTLGANEGLRLAATDRFSNRRQVCLISNDVQVSGRFIQQTADILFGAKRALVGHRLVAWDSGWNTFDGRTFGYLEGYFLAATVDGWVDLNYFDENYAPYDFEDVDLSTAAKQKGYQLVPLNNPVIKHLGGGTLGYNPAREAITKRNQEYFRKKWVK